MAVSLASLLVRQGKAVLYTAAIGVATVIGLPVSTWQAGDPTRSLYHVESEILDTLEANVIGYIQSGFLDYATGIWLKVLAQQVYGVVVPDATFATTDVLLTNTGGGVYDFDPGDLILKSTTSGKTYRNTTGGPLGIGGTLTVTVIADEAGSGSSAGAGEINDLVTGQLGVTCANATAAVGVDEQDESVTKQQCRDKLGSLSPNGPKEAYSYVARNSTLSGTNAVTRVRVFGNSDTGDVTVYLAGPGGGVAEADRALVETAIRTYATPLCITPTVFAATNVVIPVTYTLWLYKSANKTAAEAAVDIEAALEAMLASRAIGGDIIAPATSGSLYRSMIDSTIRTTFPQAFRVTVDTPTGDTALTNGQVAVLGTVTFTINLVTDP